MVDSRGFRRVLVALGGMVWALLAAPGQGQDLSTYTVADIPVDATAGDAVAARSEALRTGQREGLARLLRRLTPAEQHARLPSVVGVPIDSYVQNFSIENEELSQTRYLADLTVTYDPTAVKALLQSAGMSFTEAASPPILVLPLYDGPDGLVLWPEGNPWWDAWVETLDPNGLLRLTLPLGDLEDMGRLTAEQVASGDRAAMLDLARRYGAEDVLIAEAGAVADGAAVRLDAERIGATDRRGAPITVDVPQGRPIEAVLDNAAQKLQSSLVEQWKQGRLLSFDRSGRMVVDVPVTALADWVRLRRTLESLPEVSRIDVLQFSREMVRAEIGYMGDEFRLEDAFFRQGLTLSREGETWQLLPTAASPPGSPSAMPAPSSSDPL